MSAGGDLVRQAYEAFSRGDIPAVLDTLAEDVKWEVPDLLPQSVSADDKFAVGEFFQRLGELYSFLDLDVQDLADGDHRVAGVGIARGELSAGGSVEYGFAHLFDVEDGKVTRFREYVDRDARATP